MNILSAFAHFTASLSSYLSMQTAQLVLGPIYTSHMCMVWPLLWLSALPFSLLFYLVPFLVWYRLLSIASAQMPPRHLTLSVNTRAIFVFKNCQKLSAAYQYSGTRHNCRTLIAIIDLKFCTNFAALKYMLVIYVVSDQTRPVVLLISIVLDPHILLTLNT